MSETTVVYGDAVLDVIFSLYGPLKHAAKLLGRAAGTTPRTAENWLRKANCPQMRHVFAIAESNDEFAAEIMRLLGEVRCSGQSSSKGAGAASAIPTASSRKSGSG